MNAHRTRYLFVAGLLLMSISTLPAHGQGRVVKFHAQHQVPDEPDFIAVAAGFDHGLALRSDGSIAAWGDDYALQVSTTPTDAGYTAIATGYYHSIALKADTSLVTWGADSGAPTGTGFTQVSGGEQFSLALRQNGSIVAWGDDQFGRVSTAPTGTGFAQVDAGYRHGVALKTDGSIVSWGWNESELISGTPVGTGFIQVSAGTHHSLALRADGTIAAWGIVGIPLVYDVPVGPGFLQVRAGPNLSFALKADGTIVGWGQEPMGDIFNKPAGPGFTQVEVMSGQSVALLGGPGGIPYCFGDGSGTLCPCFNHGGKRRGCANASVFEGATLGSSGDPSLTSDTFQLEVTGLPSNTFGLIIAGQTQANLGAGSPLGDGLYCISGATIRSHVQLAVNGSTTFVDFHGAPIALMSSPVGSQSNYQFWYRDIGNTCSGSGFNFSNAWAVTWKP